MLYDFELCEGLTEMRDAMRSINQSGYELVTVTQCGDLYTVFFRRTADG